MFIHQMAPLLFSLNIQAVYFCHPGCDGGVRWHGEVATRGDSNGSDFWSVRETGTFKLLGEESVVEFFEPLKDGGVIIFSRKGLLCNTVNLGWRETVAKHIVYEEVMEFVWTHKVFCFLSDYTIYRR